MGWNEFIDNIISLGLMAVEIPKFILKIAEMFPKILDLFFYITDPKKLINDLIFGVVKGFYMVLDAIMDTLFGDLRRRMGKTDKGSNDGSGTLNKEKCIPSSMVEILLLVLCPPLALVLKTGVKGLFYVFISSILTYFYYFPGLIYTSLFIL